MCGRKSYQPFQVESLAENWSSSRGVLDIVNDAFNRLARKRPQSVDSSKVDFRWRHQEAHAEGKIQ